MNRFVIAALLLALPSLGLEAKAETLTLTLDDVTVGDCGVAWLEHGCSMQYETTTSEDRTAGYCLVISDANNFGKQGVYLYPARLALDLSGIRGLERVEVDVYETHFAGSTRAFLYRDGTGVASTQSIMEDDQTLVLELSGQDVDRFVVSAHESYVWEIRLIGASIVPTAAPSLSAIKALYR